mmetsp:Transcript_83186/g.165115  ORF Transcript_83186/g.165115 Transcript_83186/m.165115 type:complete len:557 (+) Transcript_83186:42-1712(+)
MVEAFYPPDKCSIGQLIFLTLVYAKILYESSGLIANGSELLLLFPSVAGLVGSIVLPILGAVPDGVMVLFSGLGPDAQSQVSVGVGALAGSTVMLLTLPWFIAIYFGRVNIGEDGCADYKSGPLQGSCFRQGVTYQVGLQKTAKIMMASTVLFLIIQMPATSEENATVGMSPADATTKQAKDEGIWAQVGTAACVIAFFAYLGYCFYDANEDKCLAKVIEGIQKKEISIGAALKFVKDTSNPENPEKGQELSAPDMQRFKKIIRPFFAMYDQDGNGYLDISEFKNLLISLGERPTKKTEQMLQEGKAGVMNSPFSDCDCINRKKSAPTDSLEEASDDQTHTFDQVVKFLYSYLQQEKLAQVENMDYNPRYMPKYEDDEEEEEMPEDLSELSPEQQLLRVGLRATWMMGLGTILVLIFSDPMVDVLSEWGTRMNISPFYISFLLAPMASNASELLSAYCYAQKRSQKSITTALSTLVGAACMNNTFCLAIFLALCAWKKLAWQFTAETLAIVVIQWVIGALTVCKKTQTLANAWLIILCYPGCLFIVWFFENIVGWD